MSKFRTESDSIGQIEVPNEKFWGAQTQRSLENFPIGNDKMPDEFINAFAIQKKSAAIANFAVGVLDTNFGEKIIEVCDEIIQGNLLLIFIEKGIKIKDNIKITQNTIEINNKILLEEDLYKLLYILQIICKEKYNYEFDYLYTKCRDIFEKKNNDYGDSFIDYGLIGILVRLGDKFNRIKNLMNKTQINYESIDDTLLDSFNYIILALILINN